MIFYTHLATPVIVFLWAWKISIASTWIIHWGIFLQFVQLERDLQQVLDEKEELVTERDVYKNKYERLNTELNYILKGDENRIVNVDTLIMDNKWVLNTLLAGYDFRRFMIIHFLPDQRNSIFIN